jgi:diguanylate cyclase (GGDEF)-like protein
LNTQGTAVRGPLIHHAKEACNECWGCVRLCPVKAIRVLDSQSEVIQEKCVKCGLCVDECGRSGHVVRDDTEAVRELLQSRQPVVALLASEFIPALHPLTAPQVVKSLETLGFHAIETTLLGEEMVAEEYEKLHVRDGALFVMRSTCPVVVDFVRKFYPALSGALAPVVPPYLAQARLIRELYPPEIAIVYVSPCYARKDEIFDPQFAGAIDVAIDFIELKRLMEESADRPARGRATSPGVRRPTLLKEISLTDGFPRKTLADRSMTDTSVQVVRGLQELDRLLRAMTAGEAAPSIIDMLNCESCIDGPAVSPGLSLFAKRNIETAARAVPGATRVSTRALLDVLPTVPTIRSFVPEAIVVPRATDEEIDSVLASGGWSRDTAPDCGACGYSTCVEHSVAVFRGDSNWEMCFPLQRSRLREAEKRLSATTTLDPMTGLWNRRALSDRLDLELARNARYGGGLSMMLLDIDGFSEVNGAVGRDAGDMVLIAFGAMLRENLRATDVVARWGGDEFALLLPGIGKTPAFAVAEKVRDAVREHVFHVSRNGDTHDVQLSVSIGVAAVGQGSTEPIELVEAADVALHEAMADGRDQVRLAPG